MGRARVILPSLYLIGGPSLTDRGDCLVYLLNGGSEAVMIDSGLGRNSYQIWDNINLITPPLPPVAYIIVTHGHIDHCGGLAYFKEKTGAKIVAHQLELPAVEKGIPSLTAASFYGVDYRPVKVDIVISGQEEVLKVGEMELKLLHTPGHTPGSIMVYTEIDGEKVLFAQDMHGPFHPQWGSDKKLWRTTMAKILQLEIDVLCEGHIGIFRPRERVREFILQLMDA